MGEVAKNEASKPNPLLEPFRVLVGSWKTEGTHPMVPGKTFHGQTTFSWIEGGAFLIMRTQIDEPEIPSGIAIFGTDDKLNDCSMIYFDERGVSRRYETRIQNNVWEWWRKSPEFSQRCIITIAGDGQSMSARGELSHDGTNWEGDLSLSYTRIA